MNRSEILDAAKACVCGHREQDYGSPEDNFKQIAKLWNAYMYSSKDVFSPVDVAIMMALFKIARIKTGTATEDSFVDLAGYAACGGEIATQRETKPATENRCVCCGEIIPEGRHVCPRCEAGKGG